jgi:phage tail-like protein
MTETAYPLTLFRFQVSFYQVSLTAQARESAPVPVCQGAFSDCTGFEATMEPKVIKAGGSNYGAQQRPGTVTFATVVLKRGITTNRHLWKWFSHVNERGRFALRLNVKITVLGDCDPTPPPGRRERAQSSTPSMEPRLTIWLYRALPVKFKTGDLNARATEVGIEELHLAHEGLSLE